MNIEDILPEGMVVSSLAVETKDDLLRHLGELLHNHPDVNATAEHIYLALTGRERLGSTGVGGGVAIPHAKLSGAGALAAAFIQTAAGVPFEAVDQEPVKLAFALLVPENSTGAHLKALARISRLLKDPDFRKVLLKQPDAPQLYRAIVDKDGGK